MNPRQSLTLAAQALALLSPVSPRAQDCAVRLAELLDEAGAELTRLEDYEAAWDARVEMAQARNDVERVALTQLAAE